MKLAWMFGLKLAVIAVVWCCWLLTANRHFSFLWSTAVVRVGMESSEHSRWFEGLLHELGLEL